jgi:hypothetical protein
VGVNGEGRPPLSCLAQPGAWSFPIEVAIGVPETGEIRAWLIKPEREWIDA